MDMQRNLQSTCKNKSQSLVQKFFCYGRWAVLVAPLLFVSFSSLSLAQDNPEQLFQNWKRELIVAGLSVSNDFVQYDSTTDKLKIPNLLIRYSGTFDISNTIDRYHANNVKFADLDEKGVLIEIEFSFPQMVMHGLEGDFESIKIEKVENTEPATMSMKINLGGMGKIDFFAKMTGWETENAVHDLPSTFINNSSDSKLSWAQVFRLVGTDRYDSSHMDLFEYGIELTIGEKLEFKMSVENQDVELLDYADGIIGEVKVANHKSEQEFLSETKQDLEAQSTSNSQIRVGGFNLIGMFELLDFDNQEATDERITLLGRSSSNKYTSDSKDSSIKIESQSIENISMKQPELDLFGIMVLSILDARLVSVELTVDLIKFFYSLELGGWKLTGLEGIEKNVSDKGKEGKSSFKIDEIKLSNLSGKGMEEFALVGFETDSYLEDDYLEIGKFSLEDIELAGHEEIEQFLDSVEEDGKFPEDPVIMAKHLAPRAFSFSIDNIEYRSKGDVNRPPVDVKIDHIKKSMKSDVPPMPTDIVIDGDDIVFPVEQMEVPEVRAYLKDLDIDELSISYNGRLYWEESTEELILKDLTLEVDDVGELEVSARMSGVTKSLLADPQNFQVGMAFISFDYAKLKFTNKGITQKLVKDGAKKLNVSDVEFAISLAELAKQELESLISEEFAELVKTELVKFLLDPKDFNLELAPAKPVNLFALLAAAAVPSSIPSLLKADVQANK